MDCEATARRKALNSKGILKGKQKCTKRVLFFGDFFCMLAILTSRSCMSIQCYSPRQGDYTTCSPAS